MGIWLRLRWLFIAALIAASTGCTSRLERATREVIDQMNAAADSLSKVTDSATAHERQTEIDQFYQGMTAGIRAMKENKADVLKDSVQSELAEQLRSAGVRLRTEFDRLFKIRGLPTEFWEMLHRRGVEYTLARMEYHATDPQQVAAFRKNQEIIETIGFSKVVFVECYNMSFQRNDLREQQALQKALGKAAPNAKIEFRFGNDTINYIVGPVNDFQAFVKNLKIGQVIFEDPGRVFVRLVVDIGQLPKPEPMFPTRTAQDRVEERQRFHQAVEERLAEQHRKIEEEKKKRELDPNAPDFFEKLAAAMTSGDSSQKSKAIDLAITADPSKASPELRSTIAKSFKQLAESGSFPEKKKAVRGLVVWGGKFSTPILLNMLESSERLLAGDVIRALGELKDERAVPALVARLRDPVCRDPAVAALRAIGPVAEDALIQIAPTPDPQLCLLAVNLLGDVGTSKSFEVLRMGLKSRNPEVRMASKNAMAKINARKSGKPADQAEQ